MTTAFGDLARFAQLPPATLSALAKADPAKLAEFASALPKDVTEATTAMADVKAEVAKLAKAAAAAQKVTSPVSADDTVAYATVTFDRTTLSASQADSVVRILEKANTPDSHRRRLGHHARLGRHRTRHVPGDRPARRDRHPAARLRLAHRRRPARSWWR